MLHVRPVRGTLVAIALLAGFAPAGAEPQQVPVMRLTAESEIAASPDQVWDYMTKGKNLVTWCPYWKSAENTKVDLHAVGDVLDYTDDWGNGGRSIVTYLDPDKELRVAHEPSDGSYMCQSKLLLSPAGKGTKVVYIEQYTDESGPDDRKATAAKMQASIEATLAALGKGVAGK
jgi:uncharacterized protein YndB with AHSA1/START domain